MDCEDTWVQELERIGSLSQNAMKEFAVDIPITILYVNRNNELEPKVHDKITLHLSDSGEKKTTTATKEVLLKKMCQYKKLGENSKYVCKELMLFHVPVEPEQMVHLANGAFGEPERFFRTYPVTDSIEIEPSIFVFHQINQLYFLFQEVGIPLKSCLKKSRFEEKGKGKETETEGLTKRVRLLLKRQTRRKETV
jgi:hypothetical protein